MRIAYLLPAPGIPVQGPSGASAHARQLVAALRASHDVRLYAARREDHRGRFGAPVPCRETGVPSWPGVLKDWRELREVRAARRLAREVERDAHDGWMPDLVIERHTLFSDAGWRLHDRLGVPWVLEVNAPPVLERQRFEEIVQRPLAEHWQRRVLQAAPHVVAVSRWLVEWLGDEMGCRTVQWVPNGVTPYRGDRERGRALLGASPDEPLLGFVGSMKPWHGVDTARAMARTLGLRLALVGHGARENSDDDGVLCPGFLSGQDLADAVAAFDVGLALYPADAPAWFSPLKILAYRAQGTPVVASNLGDVPALIEDGGAVVPPGDTDAVARAIRAWLGHRTPPRVRSWRSVAREVVGFAGAAADRSAEVARV